MVALTVLYGLRTDLVPQIPNFLAQENLLHVNYTNVFATHLIVTTNKR